MGRSLRIGVVVAAALAATGFLIVTLSLDSFVQSRIERVGSGMTGTRVTVDGVSISPFSGRGTIRGFRVENPEGYGRAHAFEVAELDVELDVRSLFSDRAVVHEIIARSPSIYLEQKLPQNNLGTILNQIRQRAPREVADSELLIERFLMTEGRLDLFTEVLGERSARVELSSLELNDLGRGEGGRAVEQVVQQLAARLIREVLEAAARGAFP